MIFCEFHYWDMSGPKIPFAIFMLSFPSAKIFYENSFFTWIF